MSSNRSSRPDQPRTLLPRAFAAAAGLLLVACGLAGWALAWLLLRAVEHGDGLLTDVGDDTAHALTVSSDGLDREAALLATSWIERAGHAILGDVSSATHRFQAFVILSLVAGVVALAVALQRRPSDRWPEWVWAAAAVLAFTPVLALQVWFFVCVPAATLMAFAATLHLTRRHDLTLARARRRVGRGRDVA